MPLYKVKRADKHIIEGLIEANDEEHAKIRSKDFSAWSVKEKKFETVFEEFYQIVQSTTTTASSTDDD